MDRYLIESLAKKYAYQGMDFNKVLSVWADSGLDINGIREQVYYDIGRRVTADEAAELYRIGSKMLYDYTYDTADFEVSSGRSDLIPEQVKRRQMKFNPANRKLMHRVGPNLYRDKYAKRYWTLKERMGEDGRKSIYLVAIEEHSDGIKTAQDTQQNVQQGQQNNQQTQQNTQGTSQQNEQQGTDPNKLLQITQEYNPWAEAGTANQ